jgi:hypothetical protein
MKEIILYLYLGGCFFLSVSCNNKRKPTQDTESLNYCRVIDTIIFNYEHKLSNLYMTNKLSLLSEKTGIADHSFKSTVGCTYENDSIFYSDMKRYRTALKCPLNGK